MGRHFSQVPKRSTFFVFAVKSNLLRLRRAVQNVAGAIAPLHRGSPERYPCLIAESCTSLWTETSLSERSLQLGKAHNLRLALRSLRQLELPAGTTFSFWAQIGRATKRRRYAEGRQISEGCLIPAIGGGLCQLSNALYEVALQAGLEIVERHPHTQIVPGSAAEQGRDATVFWNYLDLRFRSQRPLMLTAKLTAGELIVQIYANSPAPARPVNIPQLPFSERPVLSIQEHSCASCDADCFLRRAAPVGPFTRAEETTAFLVDCALPEFVAYLRSVRQSQDVLGVPLDGKKYGKAHYAWDTEGYAKVESASLQTLLRAFHARRLNGQGAARQTARLEASERLAHHYARLLTPDITRICVSQTLLPFLWEQGHLGGRQFEVLMTRLPVSLLETTLDAAFVRHPDRSTLRDFRAPDWIREAEKEALAAASRIVTPNPALAALFPERAHLLDWEMPAPMVWTTGKAVLFPYPTLARKGAVALRDAARELKVEVVLLGANYEGADFWEGVKTRQLVPGENPFTGICAVVSPAVIEENPRLLLSAVAAGIPVFASPASGLEKLSGVTTIAPDCAASVMQCLESLVGVVHV